MATGIHEDTTWFGGTDKTTAGWAQQGSHPPTSCPAPWGTCLLWNLYSHGLPPPHIRWSELEETHKNSYCGLGSLRHCLGTKNAPMAGWTWPGKDGHIPWSLRQKGTLTLFHLSVKAAMGSGGSIEMLSANAGALGGHEVARNGSGWPGQLQDGCVAGDGL